MSYTASTIGFGELPFPFTQEQRLWVTISIYLTVIGWAYAIGSLLALFQSRAFRQARALQQFTHKVARLREPFLLLVGYGRTGELLGRSFDAMGRRFVVIDGNEDRIDALDLASYHADVPGLVADARNPGHLGVAGLANPQCEAVLALTNDDEANLAVTMTAALLRPELPVIARTISQSIGERMRAFGSPDRGRPVRPVRRPPAHRAARPGHLPADDVAGERAGGAAAAAGQPAGRGPLGDVRLRPVRPAPHRGPAGRGPGGDHRRAEADPGDRGAWWSATGSSPR